MAPSGRFPMVAVRGSDPADPNAWGAAYPQPTENWMLSPETVWFARTMR